MLEAQIEKMKQPRERVVEEKAPEPVARDDGLDAEREREMQKMRDQLTKLQRDIETKDAQIQTMEAKIKTMEKEIQTLERKVEEQKQQIQKLEAGGNDAMTKMLQQELA